MAKSDIPFDTLDFSRVRRQPGKPAYLADKPVNGFDTETTNGRVFLMSFCYAGSEPEALHNKGKPLDPDTLFKALTNRRARGAVNVWFNLDFDVNVMLAALPKEALLDLTVFNECKWEGYTIGYIPGKLLSIKDPHKHVYQHFDVAQFFFGSLDKASEEWLGKRKAKDGLDVTRFSDAEYVKENWTSILHYAKEDARLVRDLWTQFSSEAEPLGIPCGKPYSTGYLAEQTYNVVFRGEGKPGFGYYPAQKIHWQAYHGGRFEIMQRGNVGQVVTVDINSAYPAVLQGLPDPASLLWKHRPDITPDEMRGFDFGAIEAVITTDPKRPVQPFAVKIGGNLKFPALDRVRISVLLHEFLYALDVGLITDYEIKDAWVARTSPMTRYPFAFVNDLYRKRQEFKRAKLDKKQTVLKIVLNSLYGKLAQLTDKTIEHGNDEEWKKSWIFYPIEVYPAEVQAHLKKDFRELHKEVGTGTYFNPFLAAHITGLTRLALLRAVVDSGLEKSVVMLATDSMMIKAGAFSKSDFLDRFGGSDLGAWEVESKGKAFVVGSGVYEVEKPNGERHVRSRGFSPSFGVWGMNLNGVSLKEAAKLAEWDGEHDTIRISHKRPLKIGQAIWQGLDIARVGVFEEWPKGITAGMDSKREWPKGEGVRFADLLKKGEQSKPLRHSEKDPIL